MDLKYLPTLPSIANTLHVTLGQPATTSPRKKKVKMTSLVDICARFIALHVQEIPNTKEGFAALAVLHLDEAVQKHMGRLNQIHFFHQYRTHYRDGKPELLENFDDEGRKHGRCLYWNDNGRVDSMLKYQHGLPHGSQKWYDQRGVLVKQLRYKKGKYKEEVIIEKRTYSPYNYPFRNPRLPLSSGTSSSASSSPSAVLSFSPIISTSLKSATTPQAILTSCATESDKRGQHRPTFSKPLSLK